MFVCPDCKRERGATVPLQANIELNCKVVWDNDLKRWYIHSVISDQKEIKPPLEHEDITVDTGAFLAWCPSCTGEYWTDQLPQEVEA